MPIIFLTALKEYVFDAFDVDATGYLLKPVGREQLFRYIDKALKRDDDSVLIKNGHDYRKILLSDIIYCESAGRKVEIHAAKRVFSYYQKIKELSGALGTGFYMPHRSYIVNLDHVQGLSGNDIIMDNGEKVPVAKVNKEDFSRKLLEHFQRGC
jgi:DNA-binding LytR/AlgR family response regulator